MSCDCPCSVSKAVRWDNLPFLCDYSMALNRHMGQRMIFRYLSCMRKCMPPINIQSGVSSGPRGIYGLSHCLYPYLVYANSEVSVETALCTGSSEPSLHADAKSTKLLRASPVFSWSATF